MLRFDVRLLFARVQLAEMGGTGLGKDLLLRIRSNQSCTASSRVHDVRRNEVASCNIKSVAFNEFKGKSLRAVVMFEKFFESHCSTDDEGKFRNQESFDGEECNASKGQHPPSDLGSYQERWNEELQVLSGATVTT